jgi:hypothetical protein
MTARWHLDGGDDLDALQHCRDQRGRDTRERRFSYYRRFAAATILNPIADPGSTPIKNSLAWAELFPRDNCEPRSKNALQ